MDLKLPSPICFDQNVAKSYEKFKQQFDLYLLAAGLEEKSDERKVALFLTAAGEEALDVYNTLNLSEADKKDYKKVTEAFDQYCKPRSNVTYHRFKFFSCSQAESESFGNFLKDLKVMAKSCNFDTQEESLIKDRIGLGIRDPNMQEKLLSKDNLDLKTAEEMCRSSEATKIQARSLQGQETVDAVIKKKPSSEGRKQSNEAVGRQEFNKSGKESYDSFRCGLNQCLWKGM
uniref:Uncharacterized protein LOC114347108 isoform X1 n=1 Tax=Diabrotica virgifera virgifera TaxID=50390 RepID=A0A6P7GVV2_DIAVI